MISQGNYICPYCNGSLRYLDTVPRIVKEEYGVKRWISVDRYICTDCRHIHRELPNYLLPYKHYRKDIITGFNSGILSQDSLEFEDYPVSITVFRWRFAISFSK